jgi:preprotein translocase subunit SecE
MSKKPAVNKNAKKKFSFKEYFKGVRTEMRKVIWPTRKESISYTSVVIMTCFAFALVFWAFDSAFLSLLGAIFSIRM